MIELDGSFGEGGGSILRQALAFSILTNKPFRIKNIRANRPKPGLFAQHLKSIELATKVCNAKAINAYQGSTEFEFYPNEIKAGKTIFIDIGTAGSISLVLQAIMLPLALSKKSFRINLIGGTNVKWSPPIDNVLMQLTPFFEKAADISIDIKKRGYYPVGNGEVDVKIKSKSDSLQQLYMLKTGKLVKIHGYSYASIDLEDSASIIANSASVLLRDYKVPVNIKSSYSKTQSSGAGIVLFACYETEDGKIELLGADTLLNKNETYEEVGERAALQLKKEIDNNVPVDEQISDQLIQILAVFKGAIKTSKITKHTLSNIYVAEKFLECKFKVENNIISHE